MQNAFLLAGVPSVVSAVWEVDDEASVRLMARFYKHLWQGNLPAIDALRQAQLDLLRGGRVVKRGSQANRGPNTAVEISVRPGKGTRDTVPVRHWAAFVYSGAPPE